MNYSNTEIGSKNISNPKCRREVRRNVQSSKYSLLAHSTFLTHSFIVWIKTASGTRIYVIITREINAFPHRASALAKNIIFWAGDVQLTTWADKELQPNQGKEGSSKMTAVGGVLHHVLVVLLEVNNNKNNVVSTLFILSCFCVFVLIFIFLNFIYVLCLVMSLNCSWKICW